MTSDGSEFHKFIIHFPKSSFPPSFVSSEPTANYFSLNGPEFYLELASFVTAFCYFSSLILVLASTDQHVLLEARRLVVRVLVEPYNGSPHTFLDTIIGFVVVSLSIICLSSCPNGSCARCGRMFC